MIAVITLKSTGQQITAELKEKKPCFCNRDFTVQEVKDIIKGIRENDDIISRRQYIKDFPENEVAQFHKNKEGYKNNPVLIYKGKFIVKYAEQYFSLKEGVEEKIPNKVVPPNYIKKFSDFDKKEDKIFSDYYKGKTNKPEEQIELKSGEDMYEEFTKCLNYTFREYGITTCLQKIHFLAQCYVETKHFCDTIEEGGSSAYSGGIAYKGRGLIHLTHDYNYLRYYDKSCETHFYDVYVRCLKKIGNNGSMGVTECLKQCKKDKRYIEKGKDDKFRKDVDDLIAAMEKVEKFRKDVSTVMIKAVGCAGWFWKESKINDVITGIDERTIRKVTKIINGGDNGLDDRIKYTKLFAKKLNYENCTNHK